MVIIEGEILKGIFLQRTSRFSLRAGVRGVEVECFLPNPGRLGELLRPGTQLLLRRPPSPKGRKTELDVLAACLASPSGGEAVVTLDARIPNALMKEALKAGGLYEFEGYRYVRSEPAYGSGRFDFLLDPPCLVEVKSCTLVQEGVALFPDAPTARGRRHLEELRAALRDGYRACIVFVVQREDALRLEPNWRTDPAFAREFQEAVWEGVEAVAYATLYSRGSVALKARIDVKI